MLVQFYFTQNFPKQFGHASRRISRHCATAGLSQAHLPLASSEQKLSSLKLLSHCSYCLPCVAGCLPPFPLLSPALLILTVSFRFSVRATLSGKSSLIPDWTETLFSGLSEHTCISLLAPRTLHCDYIPSTEAS